MKTTIRWVIPWMTAVAVMGLGCSKEETKSEAPPAKSASAKSAPEVPSTPPPPPAPAPPTPRVDCPKGSTGEGTFDKPCEASGTDRKMEVTWTGKIDDQGPKFRVVNKTKSAILHGKVVVYYYDKAGKQLEIPTSEGSTNTSPKLFQTCSGTIFAGAVKPEETIFVYFSCAKKAKVPEGTKAIEAEIQTVGFGDETEKAVSFYWRNSELAPDTRPKGGIKPKKK
ncbi:MAG: hypothetical protein ACM3ZE_07450 [Myxococcales bacterium]